jgi:exodeoxyribonuclease VII large subunit
VDLLVQGLAHRAPDTARAQDRVQGLAGRLQRAQARRLESHAARLGAAGAQLRAFDPQNTLARGYAIVRDDQGVIVRDAAQLTAGQRLGLAFSRGEALADVVQVREVGE